MEKGKFAVVSSCDLTWYDDYAKVEERAKRLVQGGARSYLIIHQVAEVKSPIPEAVVTKFAA